MRTGTGRLLSGHISKGTSAFTLLEVMISLTLLVIAFLGCAPFLVASARSYDLIMEESIAIQALRQQAETIRGIPFGRIATTCAGTTFTSDKIGGSGTIRVFVNENDSSADARLLGLPRDLDGDGRVATTDVTSKYLLLPIRIDINWQGSRGPESKALYLLYAQEAN